MTRKIKVLSVRLGKLCAGCYPVLAKHAKGERSVAIIYRGTFMKIGGGNKRAWAWEAQGQSAQFWKAKATCQFSPFPRRVDALDEIKRALNMRKETK